MANNEPAADVLIHLSDVAAGYGRQTVLRDVNMTVRAGEFWFLLGANGAGKSTLVNLILGSLPTMSGRVMLHESLDNCRRIGLIPQKLSFSDSMPTTVREFVSLGLVGLKLTRAQRQARVAEALASVELADLRARDFWSLSGGQQQRAIVARALVRRPRVLVLDEPTAGLDPMAEASLITLLAELNRSANLTLLFVCHDLALAARHGSHVAMFCGGTVATGPRQQVLTPGNLYEAFGMPLPPEVQRATAKEQP